ncbi:vicilin-like antimicrobial peptides 2-2 [Carex littledalei]|uniref:Vicilin-like antimicrobial peptides 2-2 n=1 Tax=Carex littledalei TaxID=544730 RepID=A0A833QT46_9POAL|nr:vicilin-like antimicrobial peptides 2-2 [Carex littledalei]
MATNLRTLLPLLLLAFLSLSALCTISQAKEDPQLRECRRECSQKPRQQREQCEERCWEKHQQRGREQERERERELVDNPKGEAEKRYGQCREQCEETQHGEAQHKQCVEHCQQRYEQEIRERGQEQGRERGQGKEVDPQERVRQCRKECREEHGERQGRQQCEQRCEEREQRRERGGGRDDLILNPRREEQEEEEEEREERGGENPYVFKQEDFKHKLETEHGNIRVLKNFAKQSKLLLGIANYRLAVVELNPRTFLLPNHWDADDVCYVVKGRGTVTVLKKEEKESHEIRQGDIMKVDAGSVVYVINSDSREKLIIVKLINPVSTPGKFEAFFGAGGENPESFYRAFSDEVLEAAFNTQRDKIERIFGKQRRGPIVRASEEQIRAMTRRSSEGGHLWPFGEGGRYGESKGTFNLLNKRPTFSNQHGELYEADSNDWRQLGDLDVKVSLANITSGSMLAPFYNSRATKIAVVVQGQGRVEIICPHLAKESETRTRRSRERYEEEEEDELNRPGQQGQRYRTIRANLSPGTVFVVPAGHPNVEIASRDENLQIMCFETRAEKNQRIFLAGRNNLLRKMEREAKELAFDTSARKVDELFDSQREEAFVPGPESRRSQHGSGGRGHGREFIESVVEAVAGM